MWLDIKPKKSLGQHFLHDRVICRRIVELLRCGPGEKILEIGPGAGALSSLLEEASPARYLALEKDVHWARQWARERQSSACQAILTDALLFDWRRLRCPWKIIGNLPYNVASPLIWDIVSQTPGLERAVFMVQKEVGQRLAALPGGKAYGALSVWTQLHADVSLAFCVGPGAFSPPPKVDSAVVALDFAPDNPPAPPMLGKLLRICFQNRRKQLGTIFRNGNLAPELLEGLDPRLRPENLAPGDFARIAAKMT